MSDIIPVFILNWNNAADTVNAVKSVLNQTYQNFIIYLADNGSNNKDVEIILNKFSNHPKIKIFLFHTNLGFTKAHNKLFEEILTEDYKYVALLNNDAVAKETWLENLIKCANEESASLVTSKMLYYYNDSKIDNIGHFMLNTGEIIPLAHMEPASTYNLRKENIGPCAGACLYSVEMIKQIGIFDNYFDTGYEDAEFGLRAVVLGYKSVFEPQAIVLHKMSVSVNKIRNFDYLLKIQLNIFYTYFKLLPLTYIIIQIPSILFKFISIVIIDILFLRIDFLKLIIKSHYLFLFKELKISLDARKNFSNSFLKQKISTINMIRKTKFFLWFDIYRFYKYVLLRKPNQYEKK